MTPFSWFNGGHQCLFNRPAATQALAKCCVLDAKLFGPIDKTLGFPLVGQQRKDFRSGWVMRRRSAQGLFNRPSGFQSPLDSCGFEAEDFGPIFHTHCLAIEGQHDVRSFIPMLLSACRPSNVSWNVALFVINAVKRMFGRWSFCNICQEGQKTLGIFGSYHDPSSAVIFPRRMLWIDTASNHVKPRGIFGSTGPAVFKFMVICVNLFLRHALAPLQPSVLRDGALYLQRAVPTILPHCYRVFPAYCFWWISSFSQLCPVEAAP